MKRILFAALVTLLLFSNSPSQTEGRVFWKGMVDSKVQLIVKGDKIETKTVAGTEYPGVYSFTTPLPDAVVTVGLNKTEGRGKASIIQQPSESNSFTAIIEIVDQKGGAKEYQLDIFWR